MVVVAAFTAILEVTGTNVVPTSNKIQTNLAMEFVITVIIELLSITLIVKLVKCSPHSQLAWLNHALYLRTHINFTKQAR